MGEAIKKALKLLFLLGFIFSEISVFGQLSSEEIKSLLIIHFCENIEFQETQNEMFRIGCFTKDERVFEVLSSAESEVKIKKKQFTVERIDGLEAVRNFDAVFYDNTDQDQLIELLNVARENHVLLITDNQHEQLFVMINIIEREGEERLSFKVNMSNLTLAGLQAKPNLLLNGGSLVDIKKAYEKFESRLNQSQKDLAKFTEELKEREEELIQKKDSLLKKDKIIVLREQEITNYKNQLSAYQKELEELNRKVKSEQALVNQKAVELEKKNKELSQIFSSIDKKQLEFEKLEKEIYELSSRANDLRTKVEEKNIVLDQQQQSIYNQRRLLILSFGFILALLLAVFAVIRSVRIRRKLNRKLTEQNDLLSNTNIELKTTNDQLNEQREELRQTLEELQKAQMQMLQSEKMASLGVLTAGVAHEINNPLNYIQGGIYALNKILKKEKSLDDQTLKMLSRVISDMNVGVKRTADIVKSLNTFSRKDSHTIRPSNIHEIIDDSLLILNHEIKDKCKVEKAYIKNAPFVKANQENLHQVFLNLILNAVQAIEGNGVLKISTKIESGDFFVIEISDTGVGIQKENLGKIFDPFFTTKDPGKGVGLGLSIVFKIIKEHNGTIKYSSEHNAGTTVTIKLPIND